MALVNQEKTFDAEAIRDTNTHNGTAINMYNFQLKTIMIHNHLDQQVTLQCQADVASGFSDPVNVGNSFNVAANTDSYQTCDSFFPFMRMTATCGTAPTTGTLTVYLIQYGE